MTDKAKLEEIKKLADAMYYAAQYLTTDASRLHKAMDEYHKFTIHECKEEPVSEDLEEASKEWLRPHPTATFGYGIVSRYSARSTDTHY
jgi:dsRNA-specific ribonuclease